MKSSKKDMEKVLSLKLDEPLASHTSLFWPDKKEYSSFRTPTGLKEKVDELLKYMHEVIGAKFTRNDFIIKAIKHYLAMLLEAKSKRELVERLEREENI